MKVVFCSPFLERPTPHFVSALEASVPLFDGAGIDHGTAFEVGCPYISAARASLARKALDAKADVIVFLDYDLSWRPEDLLKLVQSEGDVVAGLYRFKKPEVEYMGVLRTHDDHTPVCRADGCIEAERVPAGFLKVTSNAVHKFMGAYPDLVFGPRYNPSVDLFNHGAHENVWWGEDYAFSRRWREMGEPIWIVPDLSLTHHGKQAFPGNYHEFLLSLGSEA